MYKCTTSDVYEWTNRTLGTCALEYLCTLHHIHVCVYLAKSHHNIRRQASDNGIFVIIQYYCCIRAFSVNNVTKSQMCMNGLLAL